MIIQLRQSMMGMRSRMSMMSGQMSLFSHTAMLTLLYEGQAS
jgi:hypothetical protein